MSIKSRSTVRPTTQLEEKVASAVEVKSNSSSSAIRRKLIGNFSKFKTRNVYVIDVLLCVIVCSEGAS